jgi:hypothetical protein
MGSSAGSGMPPTSARWPSAASLACPRPPNPTNGARSRRSGAQTAAGKPYAGFLFHSAAQAEAEERVKRRASSSTDDKHICCRSALICVRGGRNGGGVPLPGPAHRRQRFNARKITTLLHRPVRDCGRAALGFSSGVSPGCVAGRAAIAASHDSVVRAPQTL